MYLQGLVESKDKTVQAIREETRRNANMLLAAAKTRDALANVEKKVELLTVQVATLEEELQSRDVLLEEVKDEMVHSTDALKVAAEIKQDLNASKRREVELSQELETQKELVKELQLEVAENIRAVRAEQALRQTEKKLNDTQMEVEVLRKGVKARDEALHFMKDEVDRSVNILSHAAETREELQKMKGYIKELRAELKSKDTKLASLHEELVVARSSARYQDPDPTTPSPCVPSPSNTEVVSLKLLP
jgi:chromosome segregation ATPase